MLEPQQAALYSTYSSVHVFILGSSYYFFQHLFFQITRGETQYHFYILPQFMSYCNKKQKPECSNTNTKIESPLAQSTISPHLHCESRGAVIAGSWDDTWAAGALHTSHMTYPSSQPHQLRHHHHHAYKFTIYSI